MCWRKTNFYFMFVFVRIVLLSRFDCVLDAAQLIFVYAALCQCSRPSVSRRSRFPIAVKLATKRLFKLSK